MSATVVITQQVRRGADADYLRWQEGIIGTARRFDGFQRVELVPPRTGVQDDWVVVLAFDTAEHLAEWLTSDDRRSHLDAAAGILDGITEHVIATPRGPDAPVAVVVTRRPRPGHEAAFEATQRELLALAADAPGYIDAELIRPVSGSDAWTLLFRFADAEHLSAWLESRERAAVRTRLDDLVEEESFQTVGGGLGGWFPEAADPDQVAPPRWKQALAVLLALFPVAWAAGRLLAAWADRAPVLVQLAANAIGVAALTWLVMPAVNRMLGWWLGSTDRRVDVAGTFGIAGVLAAMAWLFVLVG
ncbi:MAG: antibiotic biosynthesis monooxygenase [Acidimicrobiia bacterium]